jgi:quercetin dioxygenase-like cupin family protein
MTTDSIVVEESAVLTEDYLAPHCRAEGRVQSSLFHPPGYSLWKVNATLAKDAELIWGSDHGDEGIMVLDGELNWNGESCGPDGAIIIEAGVETSLRAVTDSTILHFGPTSSEAPTDGPQGPASADDRSVHVVNSEPERIIAGVLFYADGTCPTCRASLFSIDRREQQDSFASPSHQHSQDEIMQVLDGEIAVGPLKITAGHAIAVPAGRRYSYRAVGSYRTLKYTNDLSCMVSKPDSEPYWETRESLVAQAQIEERPFQAAR